jgi:hypothetical protein
VAQLHAGLFSHDLAAFDQGTIFREPPMRLHVTIAIGIQDTEFNRT